MDRWITQTQTMCENNTGLGMTEAPVIIVHSIRADLGSEQKVLRSRFDLLEIMVKFLTNHFKREKKNARKEKATTRCCGLRFIKVRQKKKEVERL